MKKNIILGTLVATLGLALLCAKQHKTSVADYKIAILQTASHPALDTVSNSFVAELKQSLGERVEITFYNAQGSVATAHALAQQLQAHTTNTAFLAIGTPAAQALASVEKTRPVIVAAVTDPTTLGLTRSPNIACVTDQLDAKNTIALLDSLVPGAQKIGLVYTGAEINAQTGAHALRNELITREYIVEDFQITSESDLAAMAELACRKVDVLMSPTDNMIASCISLVAGIAKKHKKPFIVSDNFLVHFGALAARGIDYNQNGKQSAQYLITILTQGILPCQLPVIATPSERILINKQVLHNLELKEPKSLQNADLVY